MENDTLDLLRSSLRRVLAEQTDVPLSSRLDELGWGDALADDAATALRTLFELKGDTLSAADALGAELARTLADSCGDRSLASAAVSLPGPHGPARWDPTTSRLHVDVLLTAPAAGRAMVVGVESGATSALAIVSPTDTLIANTIAGEDPWLGLVHVSGSLPAALITWIQPSVASDAARAVEASGRRLLAAELVGVGAHVVAIAVAYTKDRIQYGKPIGVFQALQHRLASAHALVVGAAGLVEEAFDTADGWTSTVAKCLAGRAAEHATLQAQQCFGAIGFTWEHGLHRYIKRAYVLDSLLGDWRTLEHHIGATILASRTVPMLGFL